MSKPITRKERNMMALHGLPVARGYTVYRGPSALNGAPIVVVVLLHSENRKTGDMVQTYILPDEGLKPTAAASLGVDASVCGNCPHRPALGGSCYVNLAQGPTVVWKGLQSGAYPDADPVAVAELVANRMVRIGTYGDPAAAPVSIWQHLTRWAQGRTGYTHQWATMAAHRASILRELVMASCDSEAEAREAQAQGWRTFRVRTAAQPVARGEFVCPASEEGGQRVGCIQCGACDGAQRGAQKASPTIIVHGVHARKFVPIAAA